MSKEEVDKISKVMKRKSGRTNTVRIQELEKEVDSLGVFITELLKRNDELEGALMQLDDRFVCLRNEVNSPNG